MNYEKISIRIANEKDVDGVIKLLNQVLTVHFNGRPDLLKEGCTKYSKEELTVMFNDTDNPVFVAVDENDEVMGYAFCKMICHRDDSILTAIKTMYIDDLCVDENLRGKHIGKSLYDYVLSDALRKGCYNVTLNVWECNQNAKRFYEKCGLQIQKTGMEKIL